MLSLICSDIDGTLLPKRQEVISAETLQKLNELKERGIRIAIASGRALDSVECAFGGRIPEGFYVISNDGALITSGARLLYHKPIPDNALKILFDFALCKGFPAFFCLERKSVVLGGHARLEEHPAFGKHCDEASSFYSLKEPVYKLGIFYEGTRPPLPPGLRIAYDDGELIEYTASTADKGNALLVLGDILFANKENIFALGDGENDIAMMKRAKYTAAVGECSNELRKVCGMHFSTALEALCHIAKHKI